MQRLVIGFKFPRQGGVGLPFGGSAGEAERPGLVAGQIAVRADKIVRQLVEPAAQLGQLASRQHLVGKIAQQANGGREVASGEGVADRFFLEVVGGVPAAGLQMLALLLLQVAPGAQEFGEQRVITEPLPVFVEAHQEHVGLFQADQQVAAIGGAGDGVAKGRAEAVERRGPLQEIADFLWLPVEDFFRQIVEYVPVFAAERIHSLGEAGHRGVVCRMLQGKRGHLQTGDPALGFAFEGAQKVFGQGEADGRREKARGFTGGEAQRFEPDFAQALLQAPPCQRQRRHFAADEHQMQLRRQVIDEKGDGGVDFRTGYGVVSVDDDHHMARRFRQFAEQGRQQIAGCRQLQSADQEHRRASHVRHGRLHGRDEMIEKTDQVPVFGVEGEPGDVEPPRFATQGIGHHRCFAEPGRRCDDRQRSPQPVAQLVDQAWPADGMWSRGGNADFGVDQRLL